MALSRGPDHRRAAAPARGRDHPREALFAPAPGIALSVDGRDRRVEGTERRRGAHRADDLCRARKPAQDRAGQGRPDHQGDRRRRAARDRRDDRSRRCICFCSSRCASAGATIRNAIAKWGWSFRRNRVDAMDRRRHRARRAAPRGGECHPRADDARARPPSRSGAGRGGLAAAAGAAAGQSRQRDLARAARRASRPLRGGRARPVGGDAVRRLARRLRRDPSRRRSAACCPSAIRTRASMRRSRRCSTA